MSRIDHKAEAEHLVDALHEWHVEEGQSDASMLTVAIEANVQATLALVEQQRIANLITVAGWVMDATAEDVGYDLDKLRTGVAGEVWAGLGLS